MAKKVDEVLSFTGHIQHVAAELHTRLQNRGQSLAAVLVRLAQPEHQATLDRIADILGRCNTHPLVVDLSQTLEQMVDAGGYDCVDKDFLSCFSNPHWVSISKVNKVESEVVQLNGSDYPLGAQSRLRNMRLQSAEILELLAFGAQFPKEQLEFPIIALSTDGIMDRTSCYPCLGSWDGMRTLRFVRVDEILNSQYRYLVVH
jgi:hypothetical protein